MAFVFVERLVVSLIFCSPSITFSLFGANSEECTHMKSILTTYEATSKQAINFSKPGIFFSHNITPDVQTTLSNSLEVTKPFIDRKYLGLPSIVGKKNKDIFNYLNERLWNCFMGWRLGAANFIRKQEKKF